jgi:hypothetical protein
MPNELSGQAPYPRPRTRVVLSIFVALSAGSALVETIGGVLQGQPVPVGVSIARNAFIWLVFGALSFAAIFTARRFPLEGGRLLQHLPTHLATFVAISFTHTLLYSPFVRYVLHQSGPRSASGSALLGNLRGDVFIYAMMVGAYYLFAFAKRPPQVVTVPATPVVPTTETPAPLKRIPLKEEGRVAFIDTAEVESIEADGDYVKLNGRFGTRTIRQSLSALERQLDPTEFVRIHRSTIASVSSIKELQPWFHGEFVAIMNSGARLKVSRTHREALTEALRI